MTAKLDSNDSRKGHGRSAGITSEGVQSCTTPGPEEFSRVGPETFGEPVIHENKVHGLNKLSVRGPADLYMR